MNRITKRKALTWCVILVLIVIFASRCSSSSNGDKQAEENLTITKEDESEKDKVQEETDEIDLENKESDSDEVENGESDTVKDTGSSVQENVDKVKDTAVSDTNSKPEKKEDANKDSNKNTPSKTENVTHTHAWTKVYEEVDNGHMEKQVVKEAWVEEVPVYETKKVYICHGCGKDISNIVLSGTDAEEAHAYNHMMNGENAGWYSDTRQEQTGVEKIPHEAEYKEVWIPKIENVLTGYKCSCGATKGI